MEHPSTTTPSRLRRAVPPAKAPAVPVAPLPLRSVFDQAVDMAFFILGDRVAALSVAIEAVAKLHVAVRAQKRRRSYLPKGRLSSGVVARATRTRVNAEEGHLLQRLVYVETERWEREQERAGQVDERDLLLRFVKHLVRIGLKRNSFYAVLGLSRLLHHYSTIETMEIYSLVIQDPDRVRDDHYYRSRKKQILEEVLARWEGFLRIESGPRGEHRFRTTAADPAARAFVADCLRHFTPWDTACVVPESFDPWSDPIPGLLFEGANPDDEHPIETNRFHATIDPDCYARLAAALALPSPAERLALPEFQMPTTPSSRDGRGGSGPADAEDFRRAQRRWDDDALSRRQSTGQVLVILTDGVERARLDLDEASRARLRVPAATELVEVRGERGETLAVWLAGFETPALRSSAEYAVRLENGREIRIRRERPDDLIDFDLEVSCRETHVYAGLRTRLIRLWWRLVDALRLPRLNPAWATMAVVLLALFASIWRPAAPTQPERPDSERTRGGVTRAALPDVRRIFVDPLGDSADARALRESLATRLAASGRFERAERRSLADAVLRGTRGADRALTLDLVSPGGQILWHAARTLPEGESSDAAAAALVEELLDEARRAATASRP